jgi:UDP-glucose 4-epimerase
MNTNAEARKNVLVTGGTGYIGTHTVLVLIESGYDVTIVDNMVNSSEEGTRRVRELTGCDEARIKFFNVDLCNKGELEKVFQNSPKFDSCIHFAALKAVGESVQKPLLYYENNLGGTFNLINLLDQYGCRTIVFSSSATVSLRRSGASEYFRNHFPRTHFAPGVRVGGGAHHRGHSHRCATDTDTLCFTCCAEIFYCP